MLKAYADRALRLVSARSAPIIGKVVSPPQQAQLRHSASRTRFDAHMREQLGGFYQAVDPGPMQPTDVSLRTGAMEKSDVDALQSRNTFFDLSYRQVQLFVDALAEQDVNLRTIGSILEIGCGGARLLRHFRCMEGVRLVGTDIDAESIAWCKENLPGMKFEINQPDPPFATFEESTFDLAIASSVFTHIPLARQGPWLAEMRRVLRPGGIFLCTVVGRWHIEKQLDAAARRDLETRGFVELVPGEEGLSLSSRETRQNDVFQTRAEVIRVFGSAFSLLDYIRGPQDLLVLRKPVV